ncbi:hypothetical protein P5V93_24300 [Mycobacteroides abscessus subsp. abscessus]|uniref:hypothetical protein n=2 Tax=Mycobacteroides abscessus TaxID=36809 RepID=UPI000928E44D|nr:hypothetical protein [Mycobacteroides abscessus]MDO3101041.1 hypothetical protein [Mycobacteroides abscessus subsp. abscessus]MDO3185003.1 hypothetical protein [Mycobacteroides abscessus subsp. abscessus]MDO3194374.1 hypothetical protein [Mycobacteroides abscessus subsp. abscessus]MDO3287634.1 hypothetical protein [Mycobacteroides abscessus subsp. abscessus]SHR26085.1 Uncharacterised protein [Mycobacteroides abscessus subsp. abscessus]
MPSRHRTHQMLRDDLLAQLRAAAKPVTTRRLRASASPLPFAGLNGRWRPLREHVYRELRRMQADALVTPIPTCGREVSWQLTPSGAATDEIALLRDLFAAPTSRGGRAEMAPQRSNPPKDRA